MMGAPRIVCIYDCVVVEVTCYKDKVRDDTPDIQGPVIIAQMQWDKKRARKFAYDLLKASEELE